VIRRNIEFGVTLFESQSILDNLWRQQSKPRPAGPTASTNVGTGGLPIRSFASHGPLDGKGIMRSNNGRRL
jgi:hypothetical protein